MNEVREASLNDQLIQTAILYTHTRRWYQMKDLLPESGVNIEELTAIRSLSDELTVHSDNVLLRNDRIVLPQTLRKRAVQVSHEGHQGMAKTKAYLRSKVWFPGMDAGVEYSVKNCASCQLLAPEPRAMIIDEYTRYPVVEVVRSVAAKTVIPVLDKVISAYGIPRVIKTDNGSPFQSFEFRKYMEHMGITHRRITPRWSRANAQAESFNKPLMKSVRSAHILLNWKQAMFKFLRQYRCTPHVTTGQTPHKLLFGREPKTMLPMVPARTMDPHINEKIRINDSDAKYRMKCYADARSWRFSCNES